jgi:undecaprenyl-diphosphatase
MEIIKYIILGIVQGFTEPIPVSSSGHLIIFKNLLSDNFLYDLNFEIIVNFGSFLAIIYFYRKEIIKISKDFFIYIKTKKKEYKNNFLYVGLVVLGVIPAGLVGYIFKDAIARISSPSTVAISLFVTAGLLYLIRNMKGKKDDKDITWKDSLFIGLYQIAALLPGISRSGATIAAGMFRNLKQEAAFKFSFMLYIPISLATMILGIGDFAKSSAFNTLWLPYLLGMIAASLVTYFALKWFKGIMLKGKLIYFVYYCIILGIIALLI